MTSYFNIKTSFGIETIDELSTNDFPTFKEFRIERKRLISEYNIANMYPYISQRCTKDWKNK